jgi:hypothetical protein
MNKHLLLIIFLISFIKTQSQEKRRFLYGNVKDKIETVYNAHIINKSTNQGTFTNESGEFRILATQNDSLQISFVGYKTTTFIVKLNHFGIKKNNFELIKTAYELDEVNIKKNNLLGFISSDSKNIKSEKKINAETLNLPYAGSRIMTPAERRLHTAKGGNTSFSLTSLSIDYVLNTISGRIKKLQKLKAIESLETQIDKIKNTYSLHIVKEYTINEFDVYKFIYFCSADENFNQVYNSGEINMILFFKKKAEEFKKLNSKDYN